MKPALAPAQNSGIHTVVLGNELALVQEGLVALCKSNPPYEVIGRAFDGADTWRLIGERRPGIAVVDLTLSMPSGLEIIQRAKEANLPTKIIIVSTNEDRKTMAACLRAGARAFLLDSASSQEFLEAFRQVAGGGIFISSELNLWEDLSSHPSSLCDPLHRLPRRQRQVLSLLVEGLRTRAIADRLELSPATVAMHRARLMRRLDIHNVAGLVNFAFDPKVAVVSKSRRPVQNSPVRREMRVPRDRLFRPPQPQASAR